MSPAFIEFLNLLGEKIPLCGWNGFSGGLDTAYDSHGTYSRQFFKIFENFTILLDEGFYNFMCSYFSGK
jgi:hypothetical protein